MVAGERLAQRMITSDSEAATLGRRGQSFWRSIPALVDRAEVPIEWLIRLCGWSAILFVLAIFAFVFREAFPLVLGGFNFGEFFTSANWRPDSTRGQHWHWWI